MTFNFCVIGFTMAFGVKNYHYLEITINCFKVIRNSSFAFVGKTIQLLLFGLKLKDLGFSKK